MSRNPVEELQSRTGIEKKEDETVHEYVKRVGETGNVDPETIDAALTFITEWHYSNTPPDDDEAFQALLRQIDGSDGVTAEPSNTGSESTAPNTGDERQQSAATDSAAVETQERPDDASPSHETETTSTEVAGKRERREDIIGLPGGSDTTETTRRGFKSGIRGREPRKLVFRFVAIVATAPVIGWMIARAWVPGHSLYDQARSLLIEILGLPGPAAIDLMTVFGIGLYLSLLVLFISDVKKRVQGMLLFVGTALALATVGYIGVFFPGLKVTPLNALSLGLGFTAGLIIESGQLLAIDFSESTFQRPTLDTGEVPEFRYAARLLFALVSIIVVVTLIQVVLAGVVRVFDFVASGIFLVLLFQFVQYDSETEYMTLGPERSGKSMLLLGLCLELLRNSETYPNPNTYLEQGLERASNLEPGNEQWPIPSTAHDEVRAASFEVISGYYFPRRLELTALDYAGQHLGQIAELIASSQEVTGDEGVPAQVATSVIDADTLFFILDVERLVYPTEFHEAGVTDQENISWGLEHYSTILNHIDPDEVIVVATKCDILIDADRVAPLADHDSFAAFRDAVTEHLLSRPDVRDLLQTTGASLIHPVYFATQKQHDEYVPTLDENGNLIPVGYDHLIDEIRSRQ